MKFLHIDDLHKYFAGACIAGFAGGIAISMKSDTIDFETVFLAVICVLLRFKLWIDDREYFIGVAKGTHAASRGFKIGVALGVMSWFPWLFAGLSVGSEKRCAMFMTVAFVISTLWIMSTWLDQRPYAAQIGWMFYNVAYMGAYFLLWQRDASWFPFPNHKVNAAYAIEAFLLIVVLFDVTASGTLNALSKISDDDKDGKGPNPE